MKTIDLSGYVKSGEGANGSSYDCISDSNVMVKLYSECYPREEVINEHELARKVYELGIPSPEPGELVTDGSRIGIRFRRINGKRSFSRMLADEPERLEELTREFARYCLKLHSTECPEGMFQEAKPQFMTYLEQDKAFNDAEKQVIADFINGVQDCGTCLHGDMHFGNVISTLPRGAALSEPHDVYFIDLGCFARGCPLFDLGMTMNICLTADEDFRRHDFHIDGRTTALAWEYFVDEYFGGKLTNAQAQDLVRPFQAVKLLLVERNIGIMLPHYERFIREAFGL